MSPRRRTGRKVLTAFLPIILIIILALAGLTGWLVYGATRPPRRAYLVTPEKFASLSDRGLKATEESWTNRDGTGARGWLVRGAEGAPAVVLLHRYGADRSWLLNLGVKLNETTNMTVLLPDLRGHGENPPVQSVSFGSLESEDVLAALDFIRGLKTQQGHALAGESAGVYGVELGAYAALLAARDDKSIRALVLDSVPDTADTVLGAAVNARTGLDNGLLRLLARIGTRFYFSGHYKNDAACTVAESLGERRVLLLSGQDAGPLRPTTETLTRCFSAQANVEAQTDLSSTGFTLASASSEEDEAYDRRVIEFFDRALRGTP
ncbi:MAG TPA: alpha/beta fold hydrolase [Pyrinomonadaceae bacterium]|jgi:pimeloyl-ACP methyl ester carboxylesterase|nr:alpha/beta fold hydrolase [Pyrinomonadaceae bacterium]